MGDPSLPQARARDWRQRGPAIAELARRVQKAAPRLRVTREYEIFPFVAGTVDEAGLRQLAACPQVEAVYPVRTLRASLSESGPLIGQPEAEAAGYDGTGVTIAIIDTGIDYTHPHMGGSTDVDDFPNAKVMGGVNLVDETAPPMDDNGHGTGVADIAAGIGTELRGIARDAGLVAVKVLNQDGIGGSSVVIRGIEWCIQNQATYDIKVINMSLGDAAEWSDPADCDAEPEGIAVAEAVAPGIVVVVASGNMEHLGGVAIPACASDAMAVGATWDSGSAVDTPVSYSNRGELLSVYAPGSSISTAKLGGGREDGQHGTSYSAPHVAGAAAILFERMGLGTSPEAIQARLERTGVPVVDSSTGVGTPRVDLTRAIDDEPSSGPDLVVTAVTSSVSSGLTGDAFTVRATVKNQGETAAGPCQVIIGLSDNAIASPQDEVLAVSGVPALDPDESHATGWLAAAVPGALPGEYPITAFADSGHAVVERDETNNGRVGEGFAIEVLSSYVGSSSVPSSMLRGQAYPVSVTLWNFGTVPWIAADGIALRAVSPEGTTRWGVSQVSLPGGQTVDAGGSVTFEFDVSAPDEPGWHPFHWRMVRGGVHFGELVTGATKVRVLDESEWGQDMPAISGDWVAYEHDTEWSTDLFVSNLTSGAQRILPDDIPFPRQWNPGGWYEPMPPYEWFDISNQWVPDISEQWATWIVDDVPLDPELPFWWFYQIAALDAQDTDMLPLRITHQAADAVLPAIDGVLVVWEDYRNDPDGIKDWENFLDDDSDIYICDVTDVSGPDDHFPPVYPICTAPGPQFAPRISGDLVVWEDWRDLANLQSDLYVYDLSVDTDGDGVPNWKDPDRPNPDPAETQFTDTVGWPEEFPDISGSKVVWMDLRRDTGFGEIVDLYMMDIDGPTATVVAKDPVALRWRPRIDGLKVVWEDWRQGQEDVYWLDLATGAGGPIAGSSASEVWPDISGDRVVYAKHRANVQRGDQSWDTVFNIWVQNMLPNGAVGVHTFTDVPSDFWAWIYIEAAVENDVVQGFSDGSYRPNLLVTRGQMAVYISRALAGGDANVPDPPISDPGFTDIPPDHWAYRYIAYAVQQNVVQGFPEGDYKPDLSVDRAQMAVYIARALVGDDSSVPAGPLSATFPDVPVGFWAYDYVEYIAGQGVTQGYPDGLYHPERLCTRAQMAVYVARAFGYLG
jgi:beta propeller repeat protein